VVHDQQVIDTLTVPTNKIKTQPGNPPSSATRTTKHTPTIGRISDGQHGNNGNPHGNNGNPDGNNGSGLREDARG